MKQIFTWLLVFAVCSMSAQEVLIDEGFESGSIPAGWTQSTLSTDGGFKFGSPGSLSSQYCTFPSNGTPGIAASNDDACNCNKSQDYLIMPALDLSTSNGLYLFFDVSFAGGSYNNATEKAYVEYSLDGGSTWEVAEQIPGGGNREWREFQLNLSFLEGNSDVLIAFHYDDGGDWTYGMGVDNVQLLTNLPANDAKVEVVQPYKYQLVGDDMGIAVNITNYGGDTLESFDLVWSDGTNTYTENVTGASVPTLETYTHTHADGFPVAAPIKYAADVWLENPNGSDDANDSDNMGAVSFQGVSTASNRKFVAEEGTGTWCGWCPRGFVFMELLNENYPDDFLGIAVHNGDPMAVPHYDNGIGNYIGGYPSATVNRTVEIDPGDLDVAFNNPAIKDALTPAKVNTVSATLDVGNKEMVISGEAAFYSELANEDYKLAYVLTENGVTGTGSGYAQRNFYSGGGSGPMGGWENLPDPVPASDMVYDDVARDIVPSFDGTNSGQSVMDGDNVPWEYTYDFPNGWNPNNMHVMLLIMDAETGVVLNGDKGDITVNCPPDLGVQTQVSDASGPDAMDGLLQVATSVGISPFTIELDNGQTGSFISGLAPGTYTLTVTDNAGCQEVQTIVVGPETSTNEISTLSRMNLTPNPTSGKALVELQFTEAVDVTVQLVNTMGQVIETAQQFGTQGQVFDFDLSKQAAGIYFVKVTVDDQTRVQRLMLTR